MPARSAGVVEVGQGAFLQLGFPPMLGDKSVGISGHYFGHAVHKIGRVQPVVAQLHQLARRFSDALRTRIDGVVRPRDVRCHAFRKGEGFERGRGRVAWVVSNP